MDFNPSPRAAEYLERVATFMDDHVYPNEARMHREIESGDRWAQPAAMEELKAEAKRQGLWNLWNSDPAHGAGLSNIEYAPLAELMGRSIHVAPEAFNCNAPDTGNMEVLERFGTDEQKERWLRPLLDGEIRSCFGMTEPDVASSDANNIATRIERDGDHYVINGRKWWTTGAKHPNNRIMILMGRSDPDAPPHRQQSQVLVPMDTPGVTVVRPLTVMGYDDAPQGHAEVNLENVRVPVENVISGEGEGFAIAQARLGPGRIHHCMRLIGMAERAFDLMCDRVHRRVAFGGPLADQGVVQEWVANSRIEIEQARLLTLKTAWLMDTVGNRGAAVEISAIKVIVPNVRVERDRPSHPGPRRGWAQRGFPPRQPLGASPDVAVRRWARRGPPSPTRPSGASPVRAVLNALRTGGQVSREDHCVCRDTQLASLAVLPNSIVVASGKSGAGKTSLASNLAGVAAHSGWRVLAVDLDPLGGLGNDLGYVAREANDRGRSLYEATIRGGGPVTVLHDIRPHLDVVCAGTYTRELASALGAGDIVDGLDDGASALEGALAGLASNYDLVVIDTPPDTTNPLVAAAFGIGRFVVTPTPGDRGSMIGLLRTVDQLRRTARGSNPRLRLLGIVVFRQASTIGAEPGELEEQLFDALGARAPIFATKVRDNAEVAAHCRSLGLLAHEYETAAGENEGWLTQGDVSVRDVEAFAHQRPGLADDYHNLAREILSDYRAQVEADPVPRRVVVTSERAGSHTSI